MIRKNLLKSLSVIMAAMMAIMTVACGANTVDTTAETAVEMAAEEEAGEDPLANTVVSASNIASAESEAGKVETVYVTADANGAVNDVIVSEWLKNAAASPEIADTTELKDIVNVKGDETFTDNGDGTLTWNANGSDIYYQGTTNKQLPVTMKITYTLDGKEITPEELAGKSGKVTIRFEYENNDKQTVEVNGKEVDVYTPFAMVSGMMLDSDKFTNVEISNGKVISDGGNIIVMGVALPGLKESLDISEDKWDELEDADEIKDRLSNSFEITADTTDFELGMTITMASSDILSDFGMTDLSGSDKLDDLKSDMEDLNDGSNKLVDGTKELKDGTTELADGTKKLYDGAVELNDGTHELKDGTSKLADGTNSLYDGLSKYTDGASKINDGAGKLSDGAKAAKDGSSQLRSGLQTAKGGSETLADGTQKVQDGVKELVGSLNTMTSDSVKSIQQGQACLLAAKNYLEGNGSYNELTAVGLEKIGLDKITADKIISDYNTAQQTLGLMAKSLSGQYTTVNNSNTQLQSSIKTVNAAIDQLEQQSNTNSVTLLENYAEPDELDVEIKTIENDDAKENDEEKTADENSDVLNNENNNNNENENVITNAGQNNTTDELITGNEGNKGENSEITGKTQTVTLDLGQVSSNAIDPSFLEAQLNEEPDNIDTLTKKNQALQAQNDGQKKIIDNQQSIINGQQELITAVLANLMNSKDTMPAQIQEAVTSIATYQSYIHAADAAYTTLGTVMGMLPNTTVDGETAAKLKLLVDGAVALNDGASSLNKGLTQLYAGSSKLDDGIGELKDGASKLHDGTSELVSNNGTLMDGAQQLNSGARDLDDGAGKLADGTKELQDGTKELYDGSIELDNGVKELLDGVTKFDEEGIKKIYEAFDGDLSDFTDRLEAIKEAGSGYKTFGGSADDVDSSVKFIIKTDSIKSL